MLVFGDQLHALKRGVPKTAMLFPLKPVTDAELLMLQNDVNLGCRVGECAPVD